MLNDEIMETTEENYDVEEIRKAEEWFESSRYGKGRIAGFVTMLMVDYAKYYHSEQLRQINEAEIQAIKEADGIE